MRVSAASPAARTPRQNPPRTLSATALTKFRLCPWVDYSENVICGFVIFLVGRRLGGALGTSLPQLGKHLPLHEQNLPFTSRPAPDHAGQRSHRLAGGAPAQQEPVLCQPR